MDLNERDVENIIKALEHKIQDINFSIGFQNNDESLKTDLSVYESLKFRLECFLNNEK